tara:strand:- start:701 stop:1537 length:837 start_codon:yes stop_codon:yes gene_type:complete
MKITPKLLKEMIREVAEENKETSYLLAKPSFEHSLAQDLMEFKPPESTMKHKRVATLDIMSKALFNTVMASTVFDGALNEEANDLQYLVHTPDSPSTEVVQEFAESLYSGKRSGFLTYYKPDQLQKMKLYLIKGHNAGFAIKDGNDIVAVHNNTGGALRGLSAKFMKDAKRAGGTKLDHFDGFLSGNYRKYGFSSVYDIWDWNGKFRSDMWDYSGVDIFNEKTSVYAEALQPYKDDVQKLPVLPEEHKLESGYGKTFEPMQKYYSYRMGMPDVIFRKL